MYDKALKSKIDAYIERNKGRILEDLKALVSIKSVSDTSEEVKPYGAGCRKALDKALSMASAMGFKAENRDYYYGLASSGEGEKTLGIFSHLDVVPEGTGWLNSPYTPIVKDGWIIGRGVSDNKNAAVIGLYVMDCIRSLGLPVRSRLQLFLGCAEETGMDDIVNFAKQGPMPDFSIVPDTSFPICHGEKGILDFDVIAPNAFEQITKFTGGFVGNMVAAQAQAEIPSNDMLLRELNVLAGNNERITIAENGGVITVSASGIASHASQPHGSVNAIKVLAEFLAGVRALSPSDAAIMALVAKALGDDYGKALGIACEDEPSGKLTCISGVAKTTSDKKLFLDFNIRYPVTVKGELVEAGLRKFFTAQGWTAAGVADSAPCYVPKDDPKIVQLREIYTNLTGKDSTPYVMGGGTYARYLTNAVGFGPNEDEEHPNLPASLGLPAGHGGVHQPDEACSLQLIYEAISIYTMAMVELDKIINK